MSREHIAGNALPFVGALMIDGPQSLLDSLVICGRGSI